MRIFLQRAKDVSNNGTFAWYYDENMKKVCFDNDIVQTLKENKSNHIGLWFKTWTETFRILIEICVSTETDSKYFCYIYRAYGRIRVLSNDFNVKT